MMKNSFQYFCNYTIGPAPYEDVASVCTVYGSKILVIGGQKALAAAAERIEASLAGSELTIAATEIFGHECTYTRIKELAELAQKLNVDMIFGVGGGKALDTAKGAAYEAGLPIFTFPTIASTCAATTALSVVYKENGDFDSLYYFNRPARHSFIDLTIIANAPDIYLQAGMGDTMGKYFECHFSSRGIKLPHKSALARYISNMCYFPLLEYGEQALLDCRQHKVSEALEEAVLANIISTSLVSITVEDCYNGAIAHSTYYALVLLPGFEENNLHGNVVAYGVLVQLAIDGKLEEAAQLKAFLQKLDIRTTLKEMGVELERSALKKVLEAVVSGPDMEVIPYPVDEDMVYDAMAAIEKL